MQHMYMGSIMNNFTKNGKKRKKKKEKKKKTFEAKNGKMLSLN